jgi:hypothetical protein
VYEIGKVLFNVRRGGESREFVGLDTRQMFPIICVHLLQQGITLPYTQPRV